LNTSISKKIIYYVTAIMVSSVLISYSIFHTVIKDTYTNHFKDEMVKSELVLNNYLQSRYTLLESGIDILLSDPRFLASIAEGDPFTAQNEIIDFKELVQADFLVVTDTSGMVIAKAGEANIQKWTVDLKPNKYQRGYNEYYNILNDSIYQVLSTPIHFFNRFTIGKLIAGYKIDHKLIHEFTQLSGADILLLGNQNIIIQSNSKITISQNDLRAMLTNLSPGKVNTFELDDEYLILNYTLQSRQGVSILLMKSLDELLTPAMNKISVYLVVFNIVMLLVSIFLIYSFMSRYLTDAINRLVESARKISKNQFDDPITPKYNDELGFLAESFNEMRITLKENKIKLEKAQEDRIRSERLAAIGQIAAGIIHDFKSPMTVITMTTEMISTGYANSDQKRIECCDNISRQVDRMVNMTQDILDYAHGKKSLKLKNIEFTSDIQNKIEFHRKKFENKKMQLKTLMPEPFRVAIDPNKFTRVLDNLIVNAYEAMSPGDSLEITVENNPDNFQVIIKDTGPGIPKDVVDIIFHPFITSGKPSGTGLGLAISHKIITDHGGAITVDSKIAKGTKFIITFPGNLKQKDSKQKTDHVYEE
jgi:signal transduction histidine kinase